MKELLTYIVKNLVTEPDAIAITETIEGDEVVYELRVAQADMGRVIGRHGRIAKEIRTLMKAAGNRENKKVSVEICD
ncbi:KH domain-containing protein [Intestinibacillus massiliensis]|uniref:KH domain-containing protein n=1 Tax=Intestinibacillus massiliensis TaxID=1871029 RepID=UPI000B34E32E|nr:KH domain-containing protein [Intestinibacillus massiliensis]MCB6365295.1 KH domain-containing protein [Intestinibacillus massiliensis]